MQLYSAAPSDISQSDIVVSLRDDFIFGASGPLSTKKPFGILSERLFILFNSRIHTAVAFVLFLGLLLRLCKQCICIFGEAAAQGCIAHLAIEELLK